MLFYVFIPIAHDVASRWCRCHLVDECHDEVFLIAHVRARVDGLLDFCDDGLVLTVIVMILLHELQDVRDIDLYLLHQLHLEYQVIVNAILFLARLLTHFVMQVDVPRKIILTVKVRNDLLFGCEFIKR